MNHPKLKRLQISACWWLFSSWCSKHSITYPNAYHHWWHLLWMMIQIVNVVKNIFSCAIFWWLTCFYQTTGSQFFKNRKKNSNHSKHLTKKRLLVYENSFPIPLLCNLKLLTISISSKIAWKAPAGSWSPSELAMFLKIDPRGFWSFVKFQDTKEISV